MTQVFIGRAFQDEGTVQCSVSRADGRSAFTFARAGRKAAIAAAAVGLQLNVGKPPIHNRHTSSSDRSDTHQIHGEKPHAPTQLPMRRARRWMPCWQSATSATKAVPDSTR